MRKQTQISLTLKKPMENVAGNAFDEVGTAFRASVYPLSGQIRQTIFGGVHEEARILFCDPCIPLAVGDGVCILTKPSESPDYKAVRVSAYPHHIEAVLDYLPMQERGALDENPNETPFS